MNDHFPQPPHEPSAGAHAPETAPANPAAPGRDAFSHLTAAVYAHLPVLVVHVTLDGAVLHINPEAARVLGYSEADLLGRNFWAVLFPGRLFAQVPRFMSLCEPVHHFTRDVPMTLRTREGKDRVIAWTKQLLAPPPTASTADAPPPQAETAGDAGLGMKSLLCMGVDLTDRLSAADLGVRIDPAQGPGAAAGAPEGPLTIMGISSEGTVDGEIVTPIAISPPATGSPAVAIAQVHDFLMEVGSRVEALQEAYARGEFEQLATIAASLGQGAYACGLLDFSARAERLHVAAAGKALGDVTSLVKEITTLVKHGNGPGNPSA
ncbi:MAG TPA: PAS domain-containing protein [Phycisphaerae bacterium]|nr:PAS domain-containing protein [Phycisphaerae bacterium]